MSEVTWPALESNPDSINSFLTRIGVSGVECVDVYSFDDEMLAFIPSPQLALILCFPSDQAADYMATIYKTMEEEGRGKQDDVFFMQQKIENACGTFALFHSLANMDNVGLGDGPFKKWLDEARSKPETERSNLLASNNELAAAHEETAARGETEQPDKVQYHFITYVAKNGNLYQIDSSAPFPRLIGPTTSETLVKDAGKAVQELVDIIQTSSFAAMALVGKE